MDCFVEHCGALSVVHAALFALCESGEDVGDRAGELGSEVCVSD